MDGLQPLLLLPLPAQVRRSPIIAIPLYVPEVGAVSVTLAPAAMFGIPGLPPPLLLKMIVTPPVVLPGHSVLMLVVGGAFSVLWPSMISEVPSNTYIPGQRFNVWLLVMWRSLLPPRPYRRHPTGLIVTVF